MAVVQRRPRRRSRGRGHRTRGASDGSQGLESGMDGNLPQPECRPRWLSCPGDLVHPPPCEPRQDPFRRRRRRGPPDRQGGGGGPGRGGGRPGVRPQAAAAARDARREGQGRRGDEGAHVRCPVHAAAGAGGPRQGGHAVGGTPRRGRRRPGRLPTPRRWRWRCRRLPELVRAVVEGHLLGGYTFTTYKKDSKSEPTGAGEVVVLSPVARRKETDGGVRDRPGRRARASRRPATGSTCRPATSPPRPSPTW